MWRSSFVLLLVSFSPVGADPSPSLLETFATLSNPDKGLGQTVQTCMLKGNASKPQGAPADAPPELNAAAKEGRNPTDEEYKVIQRWFREKARANLKECLNQAGVSQDGQRRVLDNFDR